jgi:hypothetical protein
MRTFLKYLLAVLGLTVTLCAQTSEPPRPYVDPALLARISKVSGFDSERVQRHFYILKNGGAIEIVARDANDDATIKAIRTFLKKESDFLSKGNLDTLAAMYGKPPESAAALKKLRDEVNIAMVPQEHGAVIRLLTVNPQAKAAVYDYLRFQIDQLKTGDPTEPQD